MKKAIEKGRGGGGGPSTPPSQKVPFGLLSCPPGSPTLDSETIHPIYKVDTTFSTITQWGGLRPKPLRRLSPLGTP